MCRARVIERVKGPPPSLEKHPCIRVAVGNLHRFPTYIYMLYMIHPTAVPIHFIPDCSLNFETGASSRLRRCTRACITKSWRRGSASASGTGPRKLYGTARRECTSRR